MSLSPTLPGEKTLAAERAAVVATMAALDPADFDHGPTLCAGWAPRDVLAHLVSLDAFLAVYLRHGLRVGAANAAAVEVARQAGAAELLERARRWAARPSSSARALAWLLIGDLVVHHEDVLRPRGIRRAAAPAVARAALREGVLLGARRLAGHRVVPTDGLAPALGVGRPVRGSTLDLGLWLAGRDALAAELVFG